MITWTQTTTTTTDKPAAIVRARARALQREQRGKDAAYRAAVDDMNRQYSDMLSQVIACREPAAAEVHPNQTTGCKPQTVWTRLTNWIGG